MLSASLIVNLQDQETSSGHQKAAENAVTGLEAGSEWLAAVGRQHRANFELWHIEDEARAPGASDADLADVKRRVDRTNQRRNDLAEELDRILLAWLELKGLPNPAAALHSETPGLMIDRLSILALKIFHTHEEAERDEDRPRSEQEDLRQYHEAASVLAARRHDADLLPGDV